MVTVGSKVETGLSELILDLQPHFDPQKAVDDMRQLNLERGSENCWRFGESDFANLPDPPAWPTKGRLPAIVLCAQLDNLEVSFDEAAIVAKARQVVSYQHGLKLDDLWLRFDKFIPNHLWWEVLDLAANWQPHRIRTDLELTDPINHDHKQAHIQCLWAAFQYSEVWAQKMDGYNVPRIEMGGYRLLDELVPFMMVRAATKDLYIRCHTGLCYEPDYVRPVVLRN